MYLRLGLQDGNLFATYTIPDNRGTQQVSDTYSHSPENSVSVLDNLSRQKIKRIINDSLICTSDKERKVELLA